VKRGPEAGPKAASSPLWAACSRRETIHLAAEKGIGALSFAFIQPEEARQWVGDYSKTLETAVPAGYAVNANIAITTTFMCCRNEQEAIDKGIDGAHFFGDFLGHYYVYGDHAPGRSNVWQEFEQRREAFGFSRKIIRAGPPEPLGAKILEQGLGALGRRRHAGADHGVPGRLRAGGDRPGDPAVSGRTEPARGHL